MSLLKKHLTALPLTTNKFSGRKKYHINTIAMMRVEQFIEFFDNLFDGQVTYETRDGRIVDFMESKNAEDKVNC